MISRSLPKWILRYVPPARGVKFAGGVLATVIVGSLASDGLATGQVFDYKDASPAGLVFVVLSVIIAFSVILITTRSVWDLPLRFGGEQAPRHARLLVLPVSPSRLALRDAADQPSVPDFSQGQWAEAEKVFSEDPWRQVLVAVRHHAATVEVVCLVGSSGERGSFVQLPALATILRQLLGDRVEVVVDDQPVDFQSVEAVYKQLDALVGARVGVGRSYREHDVVLDATGGFGPSKIAVAFATLHRRVSFQYVTSDENPRVIGFEHELVSR